MRILYDCIDAAFAHERQFIILEPNSNKIVPTRAVHDNFESGRLLKQQQASLAEANLRKSTAKLGAN